MNKNYDIPRKSWGPIRNIDATIPERAKVLASQEGKTVAQLIEDLIEEREARGTHEPAPLQEQPIVDKIDDLRNQLDELMAEQRKITSRIGETKPSPQTSNQKQSTAPSSSNRGKTVGLQQNKTQHQQGTQRTTDPRQRAQNKAQSDWLKKVDDLFTQADTYKNPFSQVNEEIHLTKPRNPFEGKGTKNEGTDSQEKPKYSGAPYGYI